MKVIMSKLVVSYVLIVLVVINGIFWGSNFGLALFNDENVSSLGGGDYNLLNMMKWHS